MWLLCSIYQCMYMSKSRNRLLYKKIEPRTIGPKIELRTIGSIAVCKLYKLKIVSCGVFYFIWFWFKEVWVSQTVLIFISTMHRHQQ